MDSHKKSNIKNNIKSTIFCLLILSTLASSVFSQSLTIENVKTLSVKTAHLLSSSGQLTLVDIRSEQEWFQSGVAPEALTISMHQAGGIKKFSQDLLTALDGDKNMPVALICASGVRSARLQEHLEQQGFTHIIDLNEGMLGSWSTEGWIKQGLPIKIYKKQ